MRNQLLFLTMSLSLLAGCSRQKAPLAFRIEEIAWERLPLGQNWVSAIAVSPDGDLYAQPKTNRGSFACPDLVTWGLPGSRCRLMWVLNSSWLLP